MLRGTLVALTCAGVLVPKLAYAIGGGQPSSSPVTMVLLLAGLSLLPFVLVMTTSFVKFSVVLSILRNAIGTPQIPPTVVVTGLSVVLTAYVMAPTGMAIYQILAGSGPQQTGPAVRRQGADAATKGPSALLSDAGASELWRAADAAKEPLRAFLVAHSVPKDRAMFRNLGQRMWATSPLAKPGDSHFLVLIPAFVIGQLAAAFKIGFLIFVPFLVIDMVVANVLLALGMHMLSPTTVSLPFKLLLFVLVDGWFLLTQGLVLSFARGSG